MSCDSLSSVLGTQDWLPLPGRQGLWPSINTPTTCARGWLGTGQHCLLLNKGLVISTLTYCVLCSTPERPRALHGIIARASRQLTEAGLPLVGYSHQEDNWPLINLNKGQTCVSRKAAPSLNRQNFVKSGSVPFMKFHTFGSDGRKVPTPPLLPPPPIGNFFWKWIYAFHEIWFKWSTHVLLCTPFI